jgi:hypothetical protein
LSNLKGLFEIFKNWNLNRKIYNDPNKRFRIQRLDHTLFKGENHDRSFKLDILINNNKRTYFIKEINDSIQHKSDAPDFEYRINTGLHGYNEMKGVKILKDLGFEVIDAHLSYSDKVSKRSYIVYDFTNLKTVEELFDKKKQVQKNINN